MTPLSPAERANWRMLTGLVRSASAEGYFFAGCGKQGSVWRVDVSLNDFYLGTAYGATYSAAVANALEIVRRDQQVAA